MPTKQTRFVSTLATVLVLLSCLGCGQEASSRESATAASQPAIDDLGLSKANTQRWLKVLEPSKASPGYTLIFFRKRLPALLDISGRVVHSWPGVRAIDRLRLLPNGHLLVISTDRVVREYDWEGREVWDYKPPNDKDFPHHDLIRLANGNILIPYRSVESKADYLLEVNRDKEVVWSWDSQGHLDSFQQELLQRDPTHINSVHELPPNGLHSAGDQRFAAGNILVSARSLSTIFIVDKESGEIAWKFSGKLDWQHEALMVGPGHRDNGKILVFNNNARGVYESRQSEILEIDPLTSEVIWSYRAPHFFSSAGGVQQLLPTGNILITSTRGGRIFEVTRDGDTVWQLQSPGFPMRAFRYPTDYAPQFAAFPDAEIRRVVGSPEPYISRELGMFRWMVSFEEVNGERRRLLTQDSVCRALTVSPRASIELSYGVDERILQESEQPVTFGFEARIEPERGAPVVLVEDTISSADERLWLEETFPLDDYPFQTVDLCLEVRPVDGPRELTDFAGWVSPEIRPRSRQQSDDEVRETREVQEVLKRRLQALGYVE